MTALSASYDSRRQDGALLAYPVAAGAHIFKGALLAVSATGLVQPASDTAGLVFAGVAYESADNTGGAAGAKSVRVLKTGVFTQPKTGAALTDVGKTALIVDDTTVSTAATTNNLACGIVVGFPDSAHVAGADRRQSQLERQKGRLWTHDRNTHSGSRRAAPFLRRYRAARRCRANGPPSCWKPGSTRTKT